MEYLTLIALLPQLSTGSNKELVDRLMNSGDATLVDADVDKIALEAARQALLTLRKEK